MMTPEEVAKRLGIHVRTVHRWLRSGKLKGAKVGNYWRVDLGEVVSMLPQQSLSRGLRLATVKAGSREVSFVGLGGDNLIVTQDGKPVAVIEQSKLNAAIRAVANEIKADTLTIEADAVSMLEAVLGAIYGIKVVSSDGQGEFGTG